MWNLQEEAAKERTEKWTDPKEMEVLKKNAQTAGYIKQKLMDWSQTASSGVAPC